MMQAEMKVQISRVHAFGAEIWLELGKYLFFTIRMQVNQMGKLLFEENAIVQAGRWVFYICLFRQ